MKLTHLGHACLLVESGGARVLIDPGGFSSGFEDAGDLDAVLVTHQHADHLDTERIGSLLAANPAARLHAEPAAAAIAREFVADADKVVDLHPGDELTFANLTVTGVGGAHAVIHPDIDRIDNVGVLLSADGEPTLLHPGDSYEAVPTGVDVLAVPLNAPWAKVSATVDFVRAVAPTRIVPVHDALLSSTGRGLYLTLLGSLTDPEQLDLAGAGAVDVPHNP